MKYRDEWKLEKDRKKREINISNIPCSMCDPISKPNSETIKFPKLSSVMAMEPCSYTKLFA